MNEKRPSAVKITSTITVQVPWQEAMNAIMEYAKKYLANSENLTGQTVIMPQFDEFDHPETVFVEFHKNSP